VRVREFRRSDASRFFALMKSQFPEEEAILGTRPEGFEALIRRLYRPDLRLLLGLAALVHRSPFHLYIAEEDGTIAGSTLLAFAPRAGFLSTVVVAPEFRRRGYAKALLERAHRETARRGRPYVALRVLEGNAPARRLYEALGYRTLDRHLFVVHDAPTAIAAPIASGSVRPFDRRDSEPLARVAQTTTPTQVWDVLPVRAGEIGGRNWADRLFRAEGAAWVVDRGRGPEAFVQATVSPMTDAAHLSTPIVAEGLPPPLVAELIASAGAWLAARRTPRIVASLADTSVAAHRALQEVGFRDAFGHFTLFRTSG
jgi:ribosomal protein S18 acetylase RimI-like enzyme